jgi:transposase
MSVKRKHKHHKKPSQKKKIDLDMTQLSELLKRVEDGKLEKDDVELIKAMAECIVFLSQAVDEKAATVRRLLRMVFGATTEKKGNILETQQEKDNQKPEAPPEDEQRKEKKKGHGRNGADAYPGAERINVPHPDLKSGDTCPDCEEGKLYENSEPGVEIRVKGSAPLRATAYTLQKLRCSLCGKIFTAPMPENAGNKKYDSSAVAIIALLKYGSGLPFNRLEALQRNLGNPLPSSTQWDILKESQQQAIPAYEKLIEFAAQGEIFHNDDTAIKIQSLIKENKEGKSSRTGMFTTGIVSVIDGRKIVLFLTGRNHAGENLNKVLSNRDGSLQIPLQMCDALSRNTPVNFSTILAHCLVHARRRFVDVTLNFPEECQFVIETLAEVYSFDAQTKKKHMTAEQRLAHHQKNSGPLMRDLEVWLNEQIDQKKVEPNSSLGDAIYYMLNHWQELTAFLRIPNAPLDNNICERALKKAILHRKNSLFFKSDNGAAMGDMYMSLIHTCELAGVSAFDYIKTLHDNSDSVRANPENWMPWNYTMALPAQ